MSNLGNNNLMMCYNVKGNMGISILLPMLYNKVMDLSKNGRMVQAN